MPVEKQVIIIYAATKKYLIDIKIEDILRFEAELFDFIDTRYPEIPEAIREKKVMDDDTEPPPGTYKGNRGMQKAVPLDGWILSRRAGGKMASMRDIKRRKSSITSTQQITKAMKLVSTVKLQKARAHAEATDPVFQLYVQDSQLNACKERQSGAPILKGR